MTVAKRLATVVVPGLVLIALARASADARPLERGSLSNIHVVATSAHGKVPLSQRQRTVVPVNSKLAFVVSLHNAGPRRHVELKVTLRWPRSPRGPLVETKTAWLRADRPATVMVGPFPQVLFTVATRLKVSISDPLAREEWTAGYPLIFSIG